MFTFLRLGGINSFALMWVCTSSSSLSPHPPTLCSLSLSLPHSLSLTLTHSHSLSPFFSPNILGYGVTTEFIFDGVDRRHPYIPSLVQINAPFKVGQYPRFYLSLSPLSLPSLFDKVYIFSCNWHTHTETSKIRYNWIRTVPHPTGDFVHAHCKRSSFITVSLYIFISLSPKSFLSPLPSPLPFQTLIVPTYLLRGTIRYML
jgi:hypothetical protein